MKTNNDSSFLFGKPQPITDELVEYYRKNPKELDLIIDKDHFHFKFLRFFFFLGLGITIGTRIMKYFFEDNLGKFINDIVLDVGSEIGIAIFGGAVTVYFLETLQKREYQQNIEFRKKIMDRL